MRIGPAVHHPEALSLPSSQPKPRNPRHSLFNLGATLLTIQTIAQIATRCILPGLPPRNLQQGTAGAPTPIPVPTLIPTPLSTPSPLLKPTPLPTPISLPAHESETNDFQFEDFSSIFSSAEENFSEATIVALKVSTYLACVLGILSAIYVSNKLKKINLLLKQWSEQERIEREYSANLLLIRQELEKVKELQKLEKQQKQQKLEERQKQEELLQKQEPLQRINYQNQKEKEKARLEQEEQEKVRLAAEKEKARLAEEEKEKARLGNEGKLSCESSENQFYSLKPIPNNNNSASGSNNQILIINLNPQFSLLTHLVSLDISHWVLGDAVEFSDIQNLKTLSINADGLNKLNFKDIDNLKELTTINLNCIPEFDKGILRNLKKWSIINGNEMIEMSFAENPPEKFNIEQKTVSTGATKKPSQGKKITERRSSRPINPSHNNTISAKLSLINVSNWGNSQLPIPDAVLRGLKYVELFNLNSGFYKENTSESHFTSLCKKLENAITMDICQNDISVSGVSESSNSLYIVINDSKSSYRSVTYLCNKDSRAYFERHYNNRPSIMPALKNLKQLEALALSIQKK